MVMSLKELDEQLKSDEERLVSSLEEYKNAKTMLRKARITSISNKFLAPFRRFRIEQAIAKYDAMIERIEKKREKDIRRAEKLQEKSKRLERKQAKADFKAAIRDKRKEDIVNFVNDKKDDIISFGEEIGKEVSDTFSYIREMGASRVSSVSSFAINVKNSAIKKVKENTTIDLTIKNAIEEVRLKYATNKLNRAVEQKRKEEEKAREQELSDAIKFDAEIKTDYKERDIPFANIQEKIDKARKDKSYMGKATNRAIDYFRKKKDSLDDKVFNARANMAYTSFVVGGKVSRAKSKVATMFNNQLEHFKDKYDAMMQERDIKRSEKIQLASDKERLKQRKKDMLAALREQEEKDISIKRAQLDSMREAIAAVNSTGDIFANAPGLDVGRAMK